MSDFKIIFVHGYTSSSKDDWYPGIYKRLKKLNIDFEIPNLPGGKYPKASIWLDKLHKVISKTNKPLVLVGHSLGTRTILLYLEKYRPKVKLVLLIAAFANRLENATKYDGDGYPNFFEHLVNIEDIKGLSEKFVVMHSKDDSLDFDQGVEIANQLGGDLLGYNSRGHFSGSKNYTEVLKVLNDYLKFTTKARK